MRRMYTQERAHTYVREYTRVLDDVARGIKRRAIKASPHERRYIQGKIIITERDRETETERQRERENDPSGPPSIHIPFSSSFSFYFESK